MLYVGVILFLLVLALIGYSRQSSTSDTAITDPPPLARIDRLKPWIGSEQPIPSVSIDLPSIL